MSKAKHELSAFEAWAAVVFVVSIVFGFLWQITGVAVQPDWLHPNLWRTVTSIDACISAIALLVWFWRSRRGWALVHTVVYSTACYLYAQESNDDIYNYLLVEAPQRLSQLVFPVACLILAGLVMNDERLPRLCGWAYVFHATSWLLISVVRGDVLMQMVMGFVNDVSAMLAQGGLALWLVHLAWTYFTDPDEPSGDFGGEDSALVVGR